MIVALNTQDGEKDHYMEDHIVIEAIVSEHGSESFILKNFFSYAAQYAKAYWQSKYPNLYPEDWDFIFANVNYKIVTRFKKGLQLNEGTKLTSYFTTITGYAILDFIKERKEAPQVQVEDVAWELGEPARAPGALESTEIATIIKERLEKWVGNREQVKVLLLFTKGYSYKEILKLTSYQSEGACRNAVVKGKKKISTYLQNHPKEAAFIKKLLQN
jgi:DNA-directed RNA polymerase specialized sigma24 family protein